MIKILRKGVLPDLDYKINYIGECRHCRCLVIADKQDSEELIEMYALGISRKPNATEIDGILYDPRQIACPTKDCGYYICVHAQKDSTLIFLSKGRHKL